MSKSKPRTIRGAIKRGWPVVRILGREGISYVGIMLAIDRSICGRYVQRYDTMGGGWFAFEEPADAVLVQMKWGTMDEAARELPKPYPGWA